MKKRIISTFMLTTIVLSVSAQKKRVAGSGYKRREQS
jgi:hypothetical protein